MPETEVKQFMTGTPVTIEADASALAAFDLMIRHGIRHLPVTSKRRVVGVLSIDDLRQALPVTPSLRRAPSAAEQAALEEWSVADLMTHAPITVRADEPLEEAALRMAEARIGCLPVVDSQGRLEGILSETDVLQAVATRFWTDRVRASRDIARSDAEALEAGLRLEHDRLLEKLARYEKHEREITATRREIPLDLAEDGSDHEDEMLTAQLADAAARRLHGLEHALRRAAEGTLGACERCGGAITPARLRAMPGTTICIGCARAAEAGPR